MFLEDFEILDYQIQHIININSLLSGTQKRFEHPHRVWEYGLTLDVIRANNVKTVLDIGGGGSIFAPACAWLDIDILQVDPGDVGQWIRDQERVINKPLPFKQQDFFEFESDKLFDAVVCLSTIEHVTYDLDFLQKLSQFVKIGGILILTTDYHPSGKAQVDGHVKTYNADNLYLMALSLFPKFVFYGGIEASDYKYEGSLPVNNYTFASLVMERIN